MKNKLLNKAKILGIILVLTFLISIPYLDNKNITAHDISYHANRIISMSEELKAGNFPVLIHSNLLNGFGYANPLFYPELFLYIPAILTVLGMNFLMSYKIFIIITTFFTLLFTYYSANKIFKKKSVAWTITILYSTAFYRLTDMYIRGAIGEVLAMVFLPLIICGLYEIIFGEYKNWWIICFGLFGIVNSHVLSIAIVAGLIMSVVLVNCKTLFKDRKRLIILVIAGIISILLAFSFLLPYLEQKKSGRFMVDESMHTNVIEKSSAVSLQELIKNKFSGGNVYKGIGSVLLILPVFILKCKNKDNQNKFMKQLFVLGYIVLFMTSTLFPWKSVCNKFEFFKVFQFTSRLNIITTVLFSFVGGYALCEILGNKEELINLVYIILIVFTLSLFSSLNPNYANFDEETIITLSPIGNAEYKPFGLIETDTIVHNVANQEEIEFDYTNKNDEMIIHIPLAYYKGYKAYIQDENGKKTKLTVSKDENSKNVIVSNRKILNGKVIVEYKMTIIQKIGYSVSSLTMILLIIHIVIDKRERNRRLKRKKLNLLKMQFETNDIICENVVKDL